MIFPVEQFSDFRELKYLPAANGSPFAAVKGETFCKIGSENKNMPFERVSEKGKLILLIVNKFLFGTTQSLQATFRALGVDVTVEELRSEVRKLKESGFLAQYEFSTPSGGKSSAKVYRLAHRGAGLLLDAGQHPRKNEYINGIDASRVKSYLAAMQLAVRAKGCDVLDDITVAEPCYIPNGDAKAKRIFRSSVTIQQPQDNTTVFIEAPRNDSTNQDILDKIKRMDAVFRNRNSANIPLRNPKLVLVCETNEQLKRIAQCIYRAYWTTPFPIYFTTDSISYTNSTIYMYTPTTLWQKLFC